MSGGSSQKTAIGFIGLGQLGAPMVANFLEEGHSVIVYNRTPEKALPLLDKGARQVRSPDQAIPEGGIVMTCVSDDAALLSLFEDEAMFQRLGASGVHVSMSTISPQTAEQLAARHAELGGIYLASPVMGRPDAIVARTQTYYISGPAEVRARVKPILASISRQVLELGDDPRAAHVAKLCSNFLIASAVESLGEAFTVAEKNGLEPQVLYDTITEFLFDCLIYKGYGKHLLSKQHKDPLFRLRLGLKDMNLVSQMANDSCTPMPVVGLLRDRYTSCVAQKRGEWDWTAIALEIRRQAGLDAQ